VATLRLFAQAREAAGTGSAEVGGATVGAVLEEAVARFGSSFAAVLGTSRVWLNGEAAEPDAAVGAGDEVAVLPPVSGGA
jgi:molybdopterin converting factor small subunit